MSEVCQQCGATREAADRFCAYCGAAVDSQKGSQNADPLLGRTVGGAYVLQELVGVGGMGRVYRAEQTVLGRTVAVKVIHPHLLGDEQTVARFYTEARASSRLNHPNSVSIIDFGRTDDGILFLAMEFLKGNDLALVMHEEGPLPFARVCDVLIGTLGALGEAHALGVVHRDLKPENIIIKRFRSGEDLVKVLDFGLATIVSGAGATSITSPGLVCGTPDYMAPEQGRGEAVDGRGDLYAAGVVLFELLTDQLPYVDETPTKVVLRHLHDPIPDPCEMAPGRGIPRELADITIRALAKRREDRYQSAEEMAAALRQCKDALRGGGRRDLTCSACGARNPSVSRFCNACGARLAGGYSAPPTPQRELVGPARPSYVPPPTSRRELVGREREMAELERMRTEAQASAQWVHLSGEPGVGKTRLLNELAEEATAAGDLVVGATPHPTRAPVAYAPVRTMLAALLDVDVGSLARLASEEGVFVEPLVRAGVSEAASPRGLDGLERGSRVEAVAAALATAVKVGAGRTETGRVILVLDDLPACDGLTMEVLAELPRHLPEGGVLIVTAGYGHPSSEEAKVIPLTGLEPAAAARFVGGESARAPTESGPSNASRFLLPLYLEQIQALGAQVGAEESVPPRLADVVAQRLDRLEVGARRVLQAASVLGDWCDLEWLKEMVEAGDLGHLDVLRGQGLVRISGTQMEITHPFIRDLVETSIPAEARRALHERAFNLAASRDAPLEVRAEHAYRAGEPMSALMLLERMGDRALEHGDVLAAVLAFRRALELARREVLETGDLMLEGAILTFSRKLGEALARTGDVAGADGVLRESLDLAGPTSTERARMLLSLGKVAMRRGRPRDAMRLLGQALEIAERDRDQALEMAIHAGIARVRREEGDLIGAANAYRKATQIGERIGALVRDRACTSLRLGDVLTELGDHEEAARAHEDALALAREADAGPLVAEATGALGLLEELGGHGRRAAERYRDAARLSAEAGDAVAHARWRKAADELARHVA